MSKPNLCIFSAQGERSFTPNERQRLRGVARVRFVRAAERLSPESWKRHLQSASCAGLTPRSTPFLSASLLRALPNLRHVSIPTTGVEWLAVDTLKSFGITVSHIPDYSTDSAAEFTWGAIIALARQLPQTLMPRGSLRRRILPPRGIELAGKTLGVVGLGAIGSRVARIAHAFHMTVLGYDPGRKMPHGVTPVPLKTLLSRSDLISLHCAQTAQTTRLIDSTSLKRIRRGALLINTARPGLADSKAVLRALHSGRLGGFAWDMGYENPRRHLRLMKHPRVLTFPHVAWYTREASEREMDRWVDSLVAIARGKPIHEI